MTSLMQFQGETGRRGVRLEFVVENPDGWGTELVKCADCGREHPRIHVAWRKPAGVFGPWIVFRYLGEEHVPDLSIPITVPVLPKGAVPLSNEETGQAWHRV